MGVFDSNNEKLPWLALQLGEPIPVEASILVDDTPGEQHIWKKISGKSLWYAYNKIIKEFVLGPYGRPVTWKYSSCIIAVRVSRKPNHSS